MSWNRREVLKSGVVASVGALMLPALSGAQSTERALDALAGMADGPRERLLLDFGWRFALGHASDADKDFGYGRGRMFAKSGSLFAPSRSQFDASAWRTVDLPHDWAVELPFRNEAEIIEFGAKPLGRAYPESSVGWYRKVIELTPADAGRRISLEFDGVYRDCIVAVNGILAAKNFSGYAPFRCDITDMVSPGRNVIVVRVDATAREGWFYEGAGIYRHVWLVKKNPVHVADWGTFVTSTVDGNGALVTIATEIENDTDAEARCRVAQTLLDPTAATVASDRSLEIRVPARGRMELRQQLRVRQPALWSIETPQRYTARTVIESSGATTDQYETRFGIRTLRFDANEGFLLNGKRVQLKGTCNHQDHAGVGAALPDRVQYVRIDKLKAMGSNAYRAAHNPPTPELLDACDALGMVVLDETRHFSSAEEGLSQLERLIRRDRNRACVIAWSIANEEWGLQGNARGTAIASSMRRLAHRLDPSRPVLGAMDSQYGKGISLAVDVQGFNYQREDIDAFHRAFPQQPSMGSETSSAYATRGEYVADNERGYVSAYDVNKPDYGALAEQWWKFFDARRFLAGGFVWTGFDYRGEPSPFKKWPSVSSHFGIMDSCGFPKDTYYYYQAWWSGKPVLHLFPHWNWPGKEGQPIDVWVHSNLDRVELFLNGASLGAKDVEKNTHLEWKVPYAPGVIEARGYKSGQHTMTAKRETTGAPEAIQLVADRARIAADGEDIAVIETHIVDAQGRVVPTANDNVTFQFGGDGKIIGVGNGDPSSHEPDKFSGRDNWQRLAFNGSCMAIVQSSKTPGSITIEASAPGLKSARVELTCTPAASRPTA